jgi:hypothetical protein
MRMHRHPYHPRAIRAGLLELIDSQPYTHCITLNSDRELSRLRMQSIFGTFCAKMDRRIHRRQRLENVPRSIRLNAIAFPEHLTTNAHLHALADFSSLQSQGVDESGLHNAVRECWLQSNRGAGSVDVQRRYSDGFASYAAKDAFSSDPVYFLAADFHPR